MLLVFVKAPMLFSNLADTTPCPMPTWLTQGRFLQHWFGFKQAWFVLGCSPLEFFVAISGRPHATVHATNEINVKTDRKIEMKRQIGMNMHIKCQILVTMNVRTEQMKKKWTRGWIHLRCFWCWCARHFRSHVYPTRQLTPDNIHAAHENLQEVYATLNQRPGPLTNFISQKNQWYAFTYMNIRFRHVGNNAWRTPRPEEQKCVSDSHAPGRTVGELFEATVIPVEPR